VLNVWLRTLVTAYAGQPLPKALEPETPHPTQPASSTNEPARRSPASYLWAALLVRICGCFPLVSPRCGHEIAPVAFITEPTSVEPTLAHLGMPTEPPQVAPSRGPPHQDGDVALTPLFDTAGPGFEFDQRVNW
jgi:hypothetical protein